MADGQWLINHDKCKARHQVEKSAYLGTENTKGVGGSLLLLVGVLLVQNRACTTVTDRKMNYHTCPDSAAHRCPDGFKKTPPQPAKTSGAVPDNLKPESCYQLRKTQLATEQNSSSFFAMITAECIGSFGYSAPALPTPIGCFFQALEFRAFRGDGLEARPLPKIVRTALAVTFFSAATYDFTVVLLLLGTRLT